MSPESGPSDDEDGRRQYGEQEFFDAIKQIENPTTGDIADVVGCSRQNALYRLNDMEEESKVSGTMIGRAKVWSVDN